MTDNEIIKALEICAKNSVTRNNGLTYEGNPIHLLFEEILGLVNRQKAEIERLTINMNAFGLGMMREKERADIARVEAAKELAERVKGVLNLDAYIPHSVYLRALNDIDVVAKEIAEGKNDG